MIMKINRNGNVRLEITNRVNGCLEQGGICGQVLSFSASEIEEKLEVTREQIEAAEWGDYVPGFSVRWIEAVPDFCTAKVVKKGVRIQ